MAEPERPLTAIVSPRVSLTERPLASKVDLRGDAGDVRFMSAVRDTLGASLPGTPNTTADGNGVTVFWLGPDEWLLVSACEDPAPLLARVRPALGGLHAAAVDVSDASTVFRLSGPAARDVLAKGCGLDVHPRAFAPGTCAQTTLARASVILHRPGEASDFDVYAPRSFAEHLGAWLADATREFAP
jgi:sarcosine oxidase subunit gamma